MSRVMLPIGIESFRELLFTRPRRFGKTLALSMLADFLDIRMDSGELFEGLWISKNKPLCKKKMNQSPVLFVTMKNVSGLNFSGAYGAFQTMISDLCIAHAYLADSILTDEDDRMVFQKLKKRKGSETETKEALYMILRMMKMHYAKSVVLLMDEYDVPLANASEQGYYTQMLDLIRVFVGKALKTNEFLDFAVVTGCLRIAKESIFTGTNNFISNSVSRTEYSDSFGFTKAEVWKLLEDTELKEHAESIRKFYMAIRICSAMALHFVKKNVWLKRWMKLFCSLSEFYLSPISKNLLASLYTCLISLDDKSHDFNSSETICGYFLLISFKAFPIDFLTYSLSSCLCADNNCTAI